MTLAATQGNLSLAIAAVVVLGVGCQWLATRLKVPSIILLLAAGVTAGPVLSLVEPAEQFGDLLFPLVSLGVGILLFEGGLGLRLDTFTEGRSVVARLVTVGVLVNWAVGSVAVALLVDVDTEIAVLIGAILVVSGPTVVGPLLRITRPREPVQSILRWEGIVIDPIGATLAIVVLDAVIEPEDVGQAVLRVLTTLGVGGASGFLAAVVLLLALERHWIPDQLHNPVTLMVAVLAFTVADQLRPEAGLMATTTLGVVLANQRRVAARHISEFEEDLGLLVLGSLFIVLGATVDLDAVVDVLPQSLAVVAVLVLVGRPLAVLASTAGSGLARVDRLFLMGLMPRGIVAAAVAALFSLELAEEGTAAPELFPVVFTVIVATVVFYGSTAQFWARRLRVARAEPRGVAIVGGQPWALDLGEALADEDVPVLIVTNHRREVERARRRGLLVFNGRVDTEDLALAVEAVGVKLALIVSPNPELNAISAERLAGLVGRSNLFELRDEHGEEGIGVVAPVIARRACGTLTQQQVDEMMGRGGTIRVVSPDEVAAGQSVLCEIRSDRSIKVTDLGRDDGMIGAVIVDVPAKEE